MAESLLALNDILVRHGDKTVLHIPHLEIESGELVALLGPTGSGKTTLLRINAGLELPDSGSIFLEGLYGACQFRKFFLSFGQDCTYRFVKYGIHDNDENQDIDDLEEDCYVDGNHFKGSF